LSAIDEYGGSSLMPRTSNGEHGFIAQLVDSEDDRVALHESP
jgi:predicted enzyme related to lactoylglutathione lyase